RRGESPRAHPRTYSKGGWAWDAAGARTRRASQAEAADILAQRLGGAAQLPGRVGELHRRFVVGARAARHAPHRLDRLPARRRLLLQRLVDALAGLAHHLDACPDLVAAARLLLGRAMDLLRDVAHRGGAAQHDLLPLLLLARRCPQLLDAVAHALHQRLDVRRGAALLLYGMDDLRDALAALACAARDRLQRLARLRRALDAGPHALAAALDRGDRCRALGLHRADQAADLLGARHHAVGELLDLVGHHREGAPVLAGLRRDDRGVEREQVGLVGDVVDHVDDRADLLGAFTESADHALDRVGGIPDRAHAGDRPPDPLAPPFGHRPPP